MQLNFSSTLSSCGRYLLENKIGSGGEGVVYSAVRVCDGKPFAVKVLTDLSFEGYHDEPIASHLAAAWHETLVLPVEPPILVSDFTALVLSRYERDLQTLLVAHPAGLPVERARTMVRSALLPLQQLHEHGLVHGDVKPANFLISACGQLHLADFGTCRRIEVRTVFPATSTYCCEDDMNFQTRGLAYRPAFDTRTMDVYALGIMVTEMLLGAVYPRRSTHEAVASIALVSEHAADFVRQCTDADFRLRPPAASLLEHAWMSL
jgi:serine/threonine protein kinase